MLLGKRRLAAIERSLKALETHPSVINGDTERTLGVIAVAVALGYLSFRLPEFGWENRFSVLSA